MKIRIPNYLKFSTFVWLLSVFLTASIFVFSDPSKSNFFGGPLQMFSLMLSISLVCSIPNWILLCIATRKVDQLVMHERKKKIIINLFAVIITFLLFLILPYFINLRLAWTAGFPYSLTLTLGIWIFPLRNKTTDKLWEEHILDDNNY